MRGILFVIPLLLLLISCSAKNKIVEVPVETVRTEYIHNIKIDSVYVRDSVDRWRDGDTVYMYREHTQFKYLNKIDTVIKKDTIPKIVKVEVVKEKEKKVEVEVNKLKWYQKWLMWIGLGSVLLISGFVIYKIKK